MVNISLDMVKTALALADAGVPVFPCKNKMPVIGRGFRNASTDRDTILRWFRNDNHSQLAFKPGDAGLLVLDVDIGANEKDLQQLPPTYTIGTPSGGRHLYFRCDADYGNRKFAAKIDTRNANGYVLIPPTEGYTVINSIEPAPLPQWVADRLSQAAEHKAEYTGGEDSEDRLYQARGLITRTAPAIEGQNGDDHTFALCCKLVRDIGISEDAAFDLLQDWNDECDPPWSDEELITKVRNAARYGINSVGERAVGDALELAPAGHLETAKVAYEDRLKRFMGQEPDEDEQQPELVFWDRDKMLPRHPCIVIIYGDSGAHKTNLMLSLCMEALFEQQATIRYAAGEGAYGVGKLRVPAHAKHRGKVARDLRGKWRTIKAVPLVMSDDEVSAFIEAQQALGKPDIVVIDTWATATVGLDENTSLTAASLTDNGAFGRIKNELGVCLAIVDHEGKIAGKSVRGSSGKRGNVDAVLKVEADKEGGTIAVTCEKMRDGRDGQTSHWRLEDVGGMPVPVRMSADEVANIKKPDESELKRLNVLKILTDNGCIDWDHGLTHEMLASLLHPGADDRTLLREQGALDNHARYKAWRSLGSVDYAEGSKQKRFKWHLPQG